MKCSNIDDLHDLVLNCEVKQQRRRISKGEITGEEFHKLWSSSNERAIKEWQQLLDKNKNFFDKYNYLDIEYVEGNKTYRRIPLSKGRPKEINTKNIRISIRLDNELQEILNDYCMTNNLNSSDAIRIAIKMLK